MDYFADPVWLLCDGICGCCWHLDELCQAGFRFVGYVGQSDSDDGILVVRHLFHSNRHVDGADRTAEYGGGFVGDHDCGDVVAFVSV